MIWKSPIPVIRATILRVQGWGFGFAARLLGISGVKPLICASSAGFLGLRLGFRRLYLFLTTCSGTGRSEHGT